jgi:rhodanese-related sulfurtransferase
VKFLIDNIWLILIALLSGGALVWPALSRSKHSVSTLEAIQLINKGKLQILDVRSTEEYSAGHLRASKHIPLKDLKSRLGELNKSEAVLVVCVSGTQSLRGRHQLAQAGFQDVYSLEGGVTKWQTEGLPIAK